MDKLHIISVSNIFGGQCNLVGVNFVKITVSLFCGKSCDQSSVNIASCKLENKELCSETGFKSTQISFVEM